MAYMQILYAWTYREVRVAVRCVTFVLSTVKVCVVFTRGSVHKHRNERRRRDDDDGRLFVRSRRNPQEKGATMTSYLVCVKGYKGERRWGAWCA